MQYESSSLARLDAFEPINHRFPSLTEIFLLKEKKITRQNEESLPIS